MRTSKDAAPRTYTAPLFVAYAAFAYPLAKHVMSRHRGETFNCPYPLEPHADNLPSDVKTMVF